MRTTIPLLLTSLVLVAVPATASADFGHVVAPGESLSSVAAADGLSVAQLAAANGLSPNATLTAGSTLQIPPQSGGPAAAAAPAAPATASAESTESGAGGYVVQPGDTLSGIAAANGLTVDQLASMNGLSPAGTLLAGSTLNLGGSSSAGAPAAQPEFNGAAGTGAQPTAEIVSPQEVGQIAAANGVPPSLAEAIGYQESGFNNNLVSPTGATGVMQIEPATWNYIGQNLLSGPPLSPSSAQDNIRGGVLLLRSLLNQTGGNASLAAAGYYQGLPSVLKHGEDPSTQQYVATINALQQRFGGP